MNRTVDIEVVPNVQLLYTIPLTGYPTPIKININYKNGFTKATNLTITCSFDSFETKEKSEKIWT
jgi:hypothetical protein